MESEIEEIKIVKIVYKTKPSSKEFIVNSNIFYNDENSSKISKNEFFVLAQNIKLIESIINGQFKNFIKKTIIIINKIIIKIIIIIM